MGLVRHHRYGLAVLLALGLPIPAPGPVWAKTAKACSSEFAANKDAVLATQTRSAFMAACRAGTEILPSPDGSGSAALPRAPATPPGAKPSPEVNPGQLPKPTARDLAEEKKLKHDMNICIGC